MKAKFFLSQEKMDRYELTKTIFVLFKLPHL